MTIAFIGHRHIEKARELSARLYEIIEYYIINENADTFLFGSKSVFNDICYSAVTQLKKKYPNIKRIYVRGEYENIHADYSDYLLTMYEETFFPTQAHNAHGNVYIKRNQVMVDMCDKVIAFFNPEHRLKHRSSGTQLAVNYAVKKKKFIYNIFKEQP